MDGIHDLGGKHGYGQVDVASGDLPAFPERWQAAVFSMVRALYAAGVTRNTDQFRYAVERIVPARYLSDGYYGRWLGGLETLLEEGQALSRAETDARLAQVTQEFLRSSAQPGSGRTDLPVEQTTSATAQRAQTDAAPRFAVGTAVCTRMYGHHGHTRLPAYARGKVGVVVAEHGAWVYPDTNAHSEGECPQILYTIEFDSQVLWGDEGEPNLRVCIDLFEPYLVQHNNQAL